MNKKEDKMKAFLSFFCMPISALLILVTCSLMPTENHNSSQTMVLINSKGKSFLMGDSSTTFDLAFPHKVMFSYDFYIDETEVTQQNFQSVMNFNPSFYHGSTMLPVESVYWYQAVQYCNARSKLAGFDTVYSYDSLGEEILINLNIYYYRNGFRLPTEAEWEYACRGGNSGLFYYNTSDIGLYEWINNNSSDRTHEVKLKKPNPYGLYDMLGNVSEWCNDFYDSTYYKVSDTIDPKGPVSGELHVIRGGNNKEDAYNCTRPYPCFLWSSLGFRCVRTKE